MNLTQNFRAPTGGENIMVVCLNCGYRGNSKLSGFPGIPSKTLKSNKCPKCSKKKLVVGSRIMY